MLLDQRINYLVLHITKCYIRCYTNAHRLNLTQFGVAVMYTGFQIYKVGEGVGRLVNTQIPQLILVDNGTFMKRTEADLGFFTGVIVIAEFQAVGWGPPTGIKI